MGEENNIGIHIIEVDMSGENIPGEHDSERIIQTVPNLMKNSILVIQPNKGKIEISMEDNQNVVINVKDDGTGIPEDRQKNYSTNSI